VTFIQSTVTVSFAKKASTPPQKEPNVPKVIFLIVMSLSMINVACGALTSTTLVKITPSAFNQALRSRTLFPKNPGQRGKTLIDAELNKINKKHKKISRNKNKNLKFKMGSKG
jgi:hypothetical protein